MAMRVYLSGDVVVVDKVGGSTLNIPQIDCGYKIINEVFTIYDVLDSTIYEFDNASDIRNQANTLIGDLYDVVKYLSGFIYYGQSSIDTTPQQFKIFGIGSGLGWSRYDDDQYTSSSKLTLLDGVTVTLPNNAATTINTYQNSTVEFYNSSTQKIQVENEGDVYIQTIVFKASASNANQTFLKVNLVGNGATPYDRVTEEIGFPKGNSITHDEHIVVQFYADTDFVNNGNQWKITSSGGDAEIWDIIFFIQRTQNHG